jgi:predicted signal transduction protein with EAL and GGDEF domain
LPSVPGNTAEELLRNADTAMYHAKTNGKARSEFFNETMRERVVTRFEVETACAKPSRSTNSSLYYQPIVSPSDNQHSWFRGAGSLESPSTRAYSPG